MKGRIRSRIRPFFHIFSENGAKKEAPKGSLLRVAGKTGALYIIRW